MRPIHDLIHQDYNCCCLFPCIGGDSLQAHIRSPTDSYVSGETIYVFVDVNFSSATVELSQVKLWLEQTLKFDYNNGKQKLLRKIIVPTPCNGPFLPQTTIEVGLQVPILLHSDFPHCRFLNVDYRLHVELTLSGCNRCIERAYDIKIGSKSVQTRRLD
ncbi:uncharacterized protein LOC107045928 [Diachasma alloeum]|uniref:uncharacterized protein LOC107045928 n=1 Tax=Diachasma alloeum TaxID=454923 RepID=UPI00073848A9|nr:uncharacterized protein LOC107045928 [Diachasma alloeum]